MFDGDRLLRLGYARQSDYARERLGVSLRAMLQWTALARGLASRPLLRRAVIGGFVSARKALIVMEAACGDDEARWTAAAASMGQAELERRTRAGGFTPADHGFEIDSIVLRMEPEEQIRLDRALSLAERVLGPGSPRWQRLEAICQEWLGEFAGLDRHVEYARRVPLDVRPGLERMLDARGSPRTEPGEGRRSTPEELDARARALVRERLAFDEQLGRALVRVLADGTYADVGYSTFDEYVRDRLGIAPRTARQRIWLERRMDAYPKLRRALVCGMLSLTKALIVARRASPATVEAMIAEAESTSVQQLAHIADEDEERQNRAHGRRRLWGPAEAFETVVFAIETAQRVAVGAGGAVPTRGAVLAEMADHFVEVWTRNLPCRRISRSRARVMTRHRGLCAVPGCSVPAAHEHHIEPRARGGSDEEGNRVALCAAHHLRGVHGGLLRLRGIAGQRLDWRFGDESWTTVGDDDVRVRARDPARRGRVR